MAHDIYKAANTAIPNNATATPTESPSTTFPAPAVFVLALGAVVEGTMPLVKGTVDTSAAPAKATA